jgi:hypothetical protein
VNSLIIDEDGIYDPRLVNDRLLLGLKGTFSELELSIFRQRSQEALRLKVHRLLTNPVYAGAYVFGRTGSRARFEGGRKVITQTSARQQREIRGKVDPRGAKPRRDNSGTLAKAQVLHEAIKRVAGEFRRREEMNTARPS